MVSLESRDVAQFGSASGLGPEGRRFESCHPDQKVWEFSSAGRASALQAGCHRFEPCNSHQIHFMKIKCYGPVVQLVRTPACHAGGREFEPHPGRHMPL